MLAKINSGTIAILVHWDKIIFAGQDYSYYSAALKL